MNEDELRAIAGADLTGFGSLSSSVDGEALSPGEPEVGWHGEIDDEHDRATQGSGA